MTLLAVTFTLVACDETHSFTFVNMTDSKVHVELAIEEPGVDQPLDLNPFSLGAGESNSSHGGIFYPGSSLRVYVTSDTHVILEKTFTYDELKEADFVIQIE